MFAAENVQPIFCIACATCSLQYAMSNLHDLCFYMNIPSSLDSTQTGIGHRPIAKHKVSSKFPGLGP
ncbi:hypothetical protein P5673_022578 [Acropora cervicornis]|uniref:Uncharacterized protein n=1 Tax=Acropora cervicornis TaxID=6130 RepID=A0AAD9Q747_ACRCE|nr:hypothetical protein P5673_022578 [Acropora cervicornis]